MEYIALDLETTGLDNKKDKIIEIALVLFDSQTYAIKESFTSFVNPLLLIPELNENITGITNDDVKNAPVFSELREKIESFIGERPIVGHNVFFDINFLKENNISLKNNRVIDTFFLSNILLFTENSLNLESLCSYFWVPFEGSHRALNDTIASITLFQKLWELFHSLDEEKKEMLYFIFSQSFDSHILHIRDFLFWWEKKPKEREFFVKNILDNLDKKIKTQEKEIKLSSLESQKYSDIIEKIPTLSFRENQQKLMEIIFENMEKSKKTVIEAPTGSGKTISYLFPAIFHSLKSWEKVFISTKTKALQDQIFYKDIQEIEKYFSYNFSYVKIKWKKNYFSVYSFLNFFFDGLMEYEKVSFSSKIVLWLYQTEYWELDELSFYWDEFGFVKNVNADYIRVLSEDNPYKKYELYYKIKEKLKEANIVILNHSLLFSDIVIDGELSKTMENLIIDEAHSIEDVATETLKKRFSLQWFLSVSQFVYTQHIKNNLNAEAFTKQVETLERDFSLFQDVCISFIAKKYNIRGDYIYFLLQDPYFFQEDFLWIISGITKKIENLILLLKEKKELDIASEIGYLEDIKQVFLVCFSSDSKKEFIPTMSYNEKYGVSVEYTYLNIGEFLQNRIWERTKNVFLLSATLKIGESFDYITSSLYLHNWFDFYSFKSDFDYQKQATLLIPDDLWSIKNNFSQISDFLMTLIEKLSWNMLILFTSLSAIKNFYFKANLPLKTKWIHLLAQSIFGSKYKILNLFQKKSDTSVIVWTDSFWEWVDLPWDDLQYLVIHKFPFLVPSDPIFEARSRLYKDSFSEYSLPKAIIKLKQGFWRLIRTKTDTWVIILLDDRIFSTKWGKEFFKSFPADINVKQLKTKEILEFFEK